MNTILVDCALVLFMRRSCFLFLFLSLSCFLVSHFFTLTDQFTDDDAPPLPWSVESDEQIIVAKTEGSPHLLLLLFCFVLSLLQGLLWSCLSFKSLVLCLFLSSTVFFSSNILLPTSMEVFFLSSNILPPTSMAANSSSTRDLFFKVAQ